MNSSRIGIKSAKKSVARSRAMCKSSLRATDRVRWSGRGILIGSSDLESVRASKPPGCNRGACGWLHWRLQFRCALNLLRPRQGGEDVLQAGLGGADLDAGLVQSVGLVAAVHEGVDRLAE